MACIEFKNVYKSFGEKTILDDINLKLDGGKIIGLLGRNGTGKSTLIKLINDLLTPTSGEVLINGEKPGIESKKIVAYLPERTYLDKSMTVDQVIKFFSEFFNSYHYFVHTYILEMVLTDKAKKDKRIDLFTLFDKISKSW